ncbi:MAG: NUDIX domain-containing protein [Halanaerobiales bacterium]
MKLIFNEKNTHNDKNIHFVIIAANYRNSEKWVFVRKKDSQTWELPAGHKEKGESVLETAKRELFEETGAKEYNIEVLSDYTLISEGKRGVGRIFLAIINKLGPLPNSEIEEIDIKKNLPKPHTYENLQQQILDYAKSYLRRVN